MLCALAYIRLVTDGKVQRVESWDGTKTINQFPILYDQRFTNHTLNMNLTC